MSEHPSTKPEPSPSVWQACLSIPLRLPTPNQLLRMHWATRSRLNRTVASEVWAAMAQARIRKPDAPLPYAIVVVERHSSTEPDPDALRGCAKPLLDAIQPASKRHPYGLGLIANDDARSIALTVLHVPCKRLVTLTRLTITAGSPPTAAGGGASP